MAQLPRTTVESRPQTKTTYTFTTDITDYITIARSNLILNGNGHKLESPDQGSDTGIDFAYGTSNVTIENMKIADFEEGMSVSGSFIQITGDTFTNCSYIAITGSDDDHCTISNNNIAEPADENSGIWLYDANNTVISNNTITGGLWATNTAYGTTAIEVDSPINNDQISGNSMTGGEWRHLDIGRRHLPIKTQITNSSITPS